MFILVCWSVCPSVNEEEEENFRMDSEVRCGALRRQGLNPIKLTYVQRQPDGWHH